MQLYYGCARNGAVMQLIAARKGAFLLFVLIAIASAQQQCLLDTGRTLGMFRTDSSMLIYVAIALSIGVIALGKFAADTLGSAPLNAWYKAELWELALTAFLILFIPFLALTLDQITCSFIPNPQPAPEPNLYWCGWDGGGGRINDENKNIFGVAHYFLGCGLTEGVLLPKIKTTYLDLMAFEFILGSLASWQLSIPLKAGVMMVMSIVVAPYTGTNAVADAHVFVVDMVGLAMAAIIAQKMLLHFIQGAAFSVFLPLGVLFRAIPITRKAGSTIIAVVIAAYFVYPTTIVLAYSVYNSIEVTDFLQYQNAVKICEDPEHAQGNIERLVGGVERDRRDYFDPTTQPERGDESGIWEYARRGARWIWSPVQWVGSKLWLGFKVLIDFGLMPFTDRGFGLLPADTTMYLFEAVIDEAMPAGQLIGFVTISLVVSMIVTITTFRDISAAIGGEGRIIGISKLV